MNVLSMQNMMLDLNNSKKSKNNKSDTTVNKSLKHEIKKKSNNSNLNKKVLTKHTKKVNKMIAANIDKAKSESQFMNMKNPYQKYNSYSDKTGLFEKAGLNRTKNQTIKLKT